MTQNKTKSSLLKLDHKDQYFSTLLPTHNTSRLLYRFYLEQYQHRVFQLENELTDLGALDAVTYATRSVQEIQRGTRTQRLLTRIKELKKELRICQYRTTRTLSPVETGEKYPRLSKESPPVPDHPPVGDVPLPEWLLRSMNESPAQSIDQKQRLELISKSSVLTLAGEVLSTSSPGQESNYREIFCNFEPVRAMPQLTKLASLKRSPSFSDLNINC